MYLVFKRAICISQGGSMGEHLIGNGPTHFVLCPYIFYKMVDIGRYYWSAIDHCGAPINNIGEPLIWVYFCIRIRIIVPLQVFAFYIPFAFMVLATYLILFIVNFAQRVCCAEFVQAWSSRVYTSDTFMSHIVDVDGLRRTSRCGWKCNFP